MNPKKADRIKVLYKGHVIRAGDVVSAGNDVFKVIRVWGHHAVLELVQEIGDAKAIPIIINPDPTA